MLNVSFVDSTPFPVATLRTIGGELLDRRVYVDGAEDQHSVFVGGAENLGHDLTLLDLLDFTIGQPGLVLEEGARLRLAGNSHSQCQAENHARQNLVSHSIGTPQLILVNLRPCASVVIR